MSLCLNRFLDHQMCCIRAHAHLLALKCSRISFHRSWARLHPTNHKWDPKIWLSATPLPAQCLYRLIDLYWHNKWKWYLGEFSLCISPIRSMLCFFYDEHYFICVGTVFHFLWTGPWPVFFCWVTDLLIDMQEELCIFDQVRTNCRWNLMD